MKISFAVALLIATAKAEVTTDEALPDEFTDSPPADLEARYGGDLDDAAWNMFYWTVKGGVGCVTDACCSLDGSVLVGDYRCSKIVVDDAVHVGVCSLASQCGDSLGVPLSDSSMDIICNDALTEANGQELELKDYMQFSSMDQGVVPCIVGTETCTSDLHSCGSLTIEGATRKGCFHVATDCETVTTVEGSGNDQIISCPQDDYAQYAWKIQNTVDQETGSGCSTVEPACSIITWGSETSVPAFCGTATIEFDNSYSEVGCYPTADCETLGGIIPGAEAAQYILECNAIGLFATAVTTFAAVATAI